MNFQFKVEVKAKGNCSYSMQNIDDRLEKLASIDTDEARTEIQFLQDLKAKKLVEQETQQPN